LLRALAVEIHEDWLEGEPALKSVNTPAKSGSLFRHVEVSLGTPREVNPVFCGREEGAKARMVINNTRPE